MLFGEDARFKIHKSSSLKLFIEARCSSFSFVNNGCKQHILIFFLFLQHKLLL